MEEAATGITKEVEIPDRVACSTCQAQGYTEFQPCKTCHGSGKTVRKISPFNAYITCNPCGGTGRAGIVNCKTCNGAKYETKDVKKVQVNIFAGVETGIQIRIPEQGDPNPKNGLKGDVFIVIFVKEHELFKREGPNLYIEVPVTYTQLVMGDKITVPTLGTKKTFDLPPGTRDGMQFRLVGMGIQDLRRKKKGDMFAVVRLDMPKINDEYKQALEVLLGLEKKYKSDKMKQFEAKL